MAYEAPTPSDLKLRYPAFAAVADETVQLWLDEAAIECASWPEDYRARAEMLYAAHMLFETGALPDTAIQLSGLTSFRSGAFSATVSDSAASRTGFATSIYGREFLALRRRLFGGPMLAWTPPAAVYP